MSNIFITSDTHFGHDRDFIYSPRGYSSELSASKAIVANINCDVKEDDELYILGDVLLGSDDSIDYLNSINCKNIHIIAGNHDSQRRIDEYRKCLNVVEVCESKRISAEGLNWFLCHYPVYTNNYNSDYHSFDALWSLCGHIHTKDPFLELKKGIMSYHCELDAHNNHPVNITQIKRDILAFIG